MKDFDTVLFFFFFLVQGSFIFPSFFMLVFQALKVLKFLIFLDIQTSL